jgi:tripartite-type tricarboxylate transporter receptor subunit TctC
LKAGFRPPVAVDGKNDWEEAMVGLARGLVGAITGLLAIGLVGGGPAAAQSAQQPYAGKTVRMVIGFGAGGGYDRWARAIARHIGKHLPGNPTVISQNMPGAGSYVAASYIYAVAPKDGTAIAAIARDAALGPLSGAPGAQFDPLKMSWIGTPTKETNICISYHTAKVKTVQDLFKQELIIGDTGPGTGTRTYPKVLNAMLGTKFKLVGGFKSSVDVMLAMERGEVEGICESYASVWRRHRDWIKDKKVNILFQGGVAPDPDPALKGIPFILDFAKTEEQKSAIRYIYAGQGIGRPFVAPPDLEPGRLNLLRAAFTATMKDPEFLAEAKKSKLDLEPEGGAYLEALIRQIYATPKPLVEKIGELIK